MSVPTLKTKFGGLTQLQTQLFATATVPLSFLASGEVRAWSSPAIPSMQGENKDVTYGNFTLSYAPLPKESASWITSVAPLGALIGGLCASYPLSRFGRKATLVASALLFLFSFILLGTCSITESMVAILIARFVMGFAIGLSVPAAQIYIAESTENNIRGFLGSVPALFMALGILITYIIGAYLPWNYLSYLCAVFPFILTVGLFWLPETPAWLVTHGRDEEARKSLEWLRGGRNVNSEFSALQKSIHSSAEAASEGPSTLKLLIQRQVLFPLFISTSLMFFQHWCGLNAVIFYTVYIFNQAGSSIEKNLATVIVGLVQFIATFFSIFLVDKAGRRILLLISGAIMTVSLSVVGSFFYLKEQDKHEGLEFLPLLGLIVYMVGYSVGYATVPFVLMGELFPNKYRSLLGGISSFVHLANLFLVIKLFTNLEALVGLSGLFWIYAAISALSCIFVLLFLTETKGKSLDEIEASFKKRPEYNPIQRCM